jgi:quercetin dioxygenase-like cupin family protein
LRLLFAMDFRAEARKWAVANRRQLTAGERTGFSSGSAIPLMTPWPVAPTVAGMKPYALGPEEGVAVENPVSVLTFKATTGQTGGAMTVFDTVVAPGEGPPLHVHIEQDEFIYVLDGSLTVRLGDELIGAKSGSFVFIARGTPHTWKNVGDVRASFCAGFVPAAPAFEEWFMRYAELPVGVRGAEALARLAAETKPFELLGPPLDLDSTGM